MDDRPDLQRLPARLRLLRVREPLRGQVFALLMRAPPQRRAALALRGDAPRAARLDSRLDLRQNSVRVLSPVTYVGEGEFHTVGEGLYFTPKPGTKIGRPCW